MMRLNKFLIISALALGMGAPSLQAELLDYRALRANYAVGAGIPDEVMSSAGKRPRIEMPVTEDSLLEVGQKRADNFASFMSILEYRYGVDREVILGVWGIETRFGQNVGTMPIGTALKSFAMQRPDRRDFARNQLRSAARLVRKGVINPNDLVGSYAGALGQTQFIPTSYERFGVDGDGNGTVDLWTARDALASTANYLHAHGWKKGQGWGMAVELPDGFYDQKSHLERQDMDAWRAAGIAPKYDDELPKTGFGRVERYQGGDYLLMDNFYVILTYNASRDYAFKVSALGDQIYYPEREGVKEIGEIFVAGANIRGGVSGKSKGPCRSKVCGLQLKLKKAGYYHGAVDGIYGPQTRKALGNYMLKNRNGANLLRN